MPTESPNAGAFMLDPASHRLIASTIRECLEGGAVNLIVPGRFDEREAAHFIGRSVSYVRKLRQSDRERLSQDGEAEIRGPRWYYEPGSKQPWYTRSSLEDWLRLQEERGQLDPYLGR
jgi:hypothetical protein